MSLRIITGVAVLLSFVAVATDTTIVVAALRAGRWSIAGWLAPIELVAVGALLMSTHGWARLRRRRAAADR